MIDSLLGRWLDDSAGVISHSVGLRLLYLRAEILHCVGTVLYNR